MADGNHVWAALAQNYSQAAGMNTDAVKELQSLPFDRVDPVAVECVTELADFFTLQATLLRKIGAECDEMAALFAGIRAEGDAFDRNSPKGKEYDRREADLTLRMKRTGANESAVEKRRLAELSAKAKTTATALTKKHGREFPDLLGH